MQCSWRSSRDSQTRFAKHKIDCSNCQCFIFLVPAMFYYTLGNIRSELRSTHRAIQLIACVTSPNLNKYGFQDILRPFIEDVNLLREVSCDDSSISCM